MFFLYILYSRSSDRYYVGQTNNIEKRLFGHNKGKHKVKFTSKNADDWECVYKEVFETRSLAIAREKYIKKQKSREYIVKLISASSSMDRAIPASRDRFQLPV